ncbi:MAG: LysM peptidoglycan-binding domain-containing protein [Planctomycetes bacterium]|nr:LysM peptidoglycan-binding domain-containing protein [Planctomycetota bacterium]
MTPEKIAVLVVTVVIAVLLSLTLLSSPGTPVTETAEAVKIEAAPASLQGDALVDATGGAAPLGLQEILDGKAGTQLAPRKAPNSGAVPIVGPVQETVVPTSVRIGSGDTLEVIARRLYGRAGAVSEILAANPGINPKRLKIGQELKLPRAPTRAGVSGVSGSSAAATVAFITPVKPSAGKVHVVAKGEKLGTIAKSRYGSPNAWKRIYDANRDQLSNPDKLVAGMKLRIP